MFICTVDNTRATLASPAVEMGMLRIKTTKKNCLPLVGLIFCAPCHKVKGDKRTTYQQRVEQIGVEIAANPARKYRQKCENNWQNRKIILAKGDSGRTPKQPKCFASLPLGEHPQHLVVASEHSHIML
jgi:hypothetical protein